MDDRIRISDADRDRIIGRLNHHFAEGRLTQQELDERVTATLNAKTFGDIRGVMADLPEPISVPPRPQRPPPPGAPPWALRRRGPRVLPLVALALLVALLVGPGGSLLFAFFKALLVIWLVACIAGIMAARRFRRRIRRDGWPGYPRHGYRDRYCG
ncbi:MAG: DUF1707 SHOCT-like domain-containing protein [Micromonosporaceae bacterium]